MKNTKRKRLPFLFVFLLISFPFFLLGQNSQFSFNRITLAENLSSQAEIEYIFCDSENFLWFSSTLGLNRFDGERVKIYLPEENIQSMFFEDNQGRVWFSTYTGIFCYERKNDRFQSYHIKSEKTGKEIRENYQLLHLDTLTNNLLVNVRGEKMLYKFNPFTKEQTSLNIQIFNVHSEIISKKNDDDFVLICPIENGLKISTLEPNEETPVLETILQEHIISSFYLENDTSLWVGVDSALVEYNLEADSVTRIIRFDGKLIPEVQGIVDPQNGTLVVATSENGIFIVDVEKGDVIDQIYSFEDGKLTAFVHPVDKMYLDPSKNLWIASDGNGMFYINLNKSKIERFLYKTNNKKEGNNNVKAISQNSKGHLYCLTESGIKVIREEGDILQIERPKALKPKAKLFYLFCDRKDDLWLFSNDGLWVKKQKEKAFQEVKMGDGINQEMMIYASQLSDNTLLMSSSRSGLFEIKENNGVYSLEKYLKLKESTGAYTLSFEDSKNRLFLCHELSSIFVYKNNNNEYTPIDTIPFSGHVTGIIEDSIRGVYWLATQIGLYSLKLHQNDTFSIQKDTLFPVKTVNGILLDSLNNLWISTNNGLFQYFPHIKPDFNKIRKYTVADGLQSREFFFWSALETSKGLFAFGGVNGVNVFNPLEIKGLQTQARPVITQIKINGKIPEFPLTCDSTGALNISEIHKLIFNHQENSLNIEVAALEYSDPTANQFRYRMRNKSKEWIYNGTDNTINLSFLSSGDYHLEVDATNSEGEWSENPHKLKIRINPPWYFSIYAIIAYILGATGLTYAYYRYRVAQIRKEADYQRMIAETETAVLRLQMNPHFIFNSMNSISSYMYQKDIDTASSYLGRFAKLMRMILDFAAKPLIEIADEVDLLTLYLETESMRFEQRFGFSIDFGDDFDPDEYLIPSMILQPFVENAILHAFTGKTEKGQIDIRFWLEEKSLFCSVIDNGIGRKAASEMNKQAKTHESKALAITQRRMELLEQKDGIVSTIEFIDLTDDNNNFAGTKVLLQFPIF